MAQVLDRIKRADGMAPVTSTVLIKDLPKGITSETIRRMVAYWRSEGIPVCSGRNGYFYARTAADLTDTIEHLGGRARAIFDVRQKLIYTQTQLRLGKQVKDIQPRFL